MFLDSTVSMIVFGSSIPESQKTVMKEFDGSLGKVTAVQ